MTAKPYDNQIQGPLFAHEAAQVCGYESEAAFVAAFELAGYAVYGDLDSEVPTVLRIDVVQFMGHRSVCLLL